MKAILVCWILFCLSGVGRASPESPFEELLRRAETVFLARVTSMSRTTVTIQCTELLRGKVDGQMTLTLDARNSLGGWTWPVKLREGAEFILLSQGDAKNGAPLPVIGHSFENQINYCGWTPFPIKREGGKIHTEGTASNVDGRYTLELTLDQIRKLLEQFPYGSKYHAG